MRFNDAFSTKLAFNTKDITRVVFPANLLANIQTNNSNNKTTI